MSDYLLYDIAITAIIKKDGKYLITRRSPTKKRWPGKWTVPGGHLIPEDYLNYPTDTSDVSSTWYNVLDRTVRREVKEEVGIEIGKVDYLTNIIVDYKNGFQTLVISMIADYLSGEVKLQEDETDKYEWITPDQVNDFDLIAGIGHEIIAADKKLK